MTFKKIIFLPILFSTCSTVFGVETLTLESAIANTINANLDIAAASAKNKSDQELIRAQYSLENPKVGFMREKNINSSDSVMNSWTISQEIMFPIKYFIMGDVQKAKANTSHFEYLNKKLEIRGKVISSYYNLYSADKIAALYLAQKETIREISRIAESRYASGSAPQQDQMKAHIEQIKIENELQMANQEKEAMSSMLNAIMNRAGNQEIVLPEKDFAVPILLSNFEEVAIQNLNNINDVKISESMAKEAANMKSFSAWKYAPDIMLNYKKPFGMAPDGAYSFGVELSIPFWFFLKQTSEYSSASYKLIEAEKNHEATLRNSYSEIQTLSSKVKTLHNILKTYESSLIPLVTTTLNSSRGLYSAGKIGFIDLLDSERMLYDTKIAYYRSLEQLVELIVKLEQITGKSLSNLPMYDNVGRDTK